MKPIVDLAALKQTAEPDSDLAKLMIASNLITH
jgi:hypothetical protein